MIYCTNCGVANREGSRFCNECGAPLGAMAPCPHCGLPNITTGRFCNFCGGRLGAAEAKAPAAASIADDSSAGPVVAPSPKLAPSPVLEEEPALAREETGDIGAGDRPDYSADLEPEPATATDDRAAVAMTDETVACAEEVAVGDRLALDWLKLEPRVETRETGGVAVAEAVDVAPSWEETVPPVVEETGGEDGAGLFEAPQLPIEALDTEPAIVDEPHLIEESTTGIALARSLRRPPIRRELEVDTGEQASAMANVFTSVVNSRATIVSLEQYRRVSKRGWFKW